MKVLKKIFYILLVLFALFSAFVLFCAFNPDITDKVADFLYSEEKENSSSAAQQEDNITETIAWPAAESKDSQDNTQRSEIVNNESGIDSRPEEENEEYIQPGQGVVHVPESVAGRNGYEPVKEDRYQIEDEEADALLQQLGMGNTGENLNFDSLFYPYYAMLDDKGKHLYRQIYANANDLNQAFSPVEEIQVDELTDIFAAVFNDHPELFFMETAYYCKYKRNGQCAEIDLAFNRTAQNLENERALFHQKAEEILSGARSLSSDYEKEKYVHDALTDRVTYNLSGEMGQSAYSALVNGQSVCAGYARAFQYLMQQLSIPCYYCTGYAGENHAWNIVALDDGYYNADVTWDDAEEKRSYDYFNKSDDDYADTHIRREMSVYLPPCSGQKYRNLEQNPGDERRSIEELGIGPDEVLTTLAAYQTDCYNKIAEAGTGSYTFMNVIEGNDLLYQWSDSYQSGAYKEDYLEDAMTAVGAVSCQIRLSAEELADNRYLLIHEIVLE